jgi:hypothetical protein
MSPENLGPWSFGGSSAQLGCELIGHSPMGSLSGTREPRQALVRLVVRVAMRQATVMGTSRGRAIGGGGKAAIARGTENWCRPPWWFGQSRAHGGLGARAGNPDRTKCDFNSRMVFA